MRNHLLRRLFSGSIIVRILFLGLLTGCRAFPTQVSPENITSINIIDRNGLTETISGKERLSTYQKTDFFSPQPYQKVLRMYGRDQNGDVHSYITSYHPNGQVKQYLQAVNNRACGIYREWHPNGVIKVDSAVIGGKADIDTQAEESWLFEGESRAWDDEGNFIAEITYSKGQLHGMARYFHPNGAVWKEVPYHKNQIDGTQKVYLTDGTLFQTTDFRNGTKEGYSVRYWNENQVAYEELYVAGKISQASYFDLEGALVSEIVDGTGQRALFSRDRVAEIQEYRKGVQEGLVKVFDRDGNCARSYGMRAGEKHGEEIDYFVSFDGELKPRLMMTWSNGVLQGPTKTWYENGHLESHKELSQNKKNGLSTAWYEDGALMLVEEYQDDKLIKGEYYRLGEKIPVSKVMQGQGIATLFDAGGNFAKRIQYHEGNPLD